jgi:hypothetical protein
MFMDKIKIAHKPYIQEANTLDDMRKIQVLFREIEYRIDWISILEKEI